MRAPESQHHKKADPPYQHAPALPHHSALVQEDDAVHSTPDGGVLVRDHDIAGDATWRRWQLGGRHSIGVISSALRRQLHRSLCVHMCT